MEWLMVITKDISINNKLMKILIFAIMGLFLSINSCKKDNKKDDILSIQRVPYTGKELRIDGYYYKTWEDYIYPMFFYQNGIILNGGGFPKNELVDREIEYKNGVFYIHVKEIKYSWGVFKIEGNKIFFERWYPSEPPYKAFVNAGDILNDTTFNITESYRMQNGEKSKVQTENTIYHFKQLTPKPDSTNSFIK